MTFSLPRPEISLEVKAVLSSVAVPVSVVTVLASMVPVVLSSRVLRTAASRVVSERVASSLFRPEILFEL